MISVILIGFGNVNSHLLQALLKADGLRVVQIYNRSEVDANATLNIPITTNIDEIQEADVYIIATSDSAIAEISGLLAFQNRLVVHTSGGVEMEKINPKNRRGVFYPLQTFSKNQDVDFKQIPICLEAENESDLSLLQTLADKISDNVHLINSTERAKIHVAAVFVNNFVNYLYLVGKEILDEDALPFDLLQPLIQETAKKIEKLTPFDAQTGPARRNDRNTIEKHLNLLNRPDHQKVYKLLTELIQQKFEN